MFSPPPMVLWLVTVAVATVLNTANNTFTSLYSYLSFEFRYRIINGPAILHVTLLELKSKRRLKHKTMQNFENSTLSKTMFWKFSRVVK